jgi:hypothetical protein
LPLVALTAVIHVIGLGLLRHRGIPSLSNLMKGRHETVVFGVMVGVTALVQTRADNEIAWAPLGLSELGGLKQRAPHSTVPTWSICAH